MGQVKQAIIEVEDFVAGCLKQGRTLKSNNKRCKENLYRLSLILT